MPFLFAAVALVGALCLLDLLLTLGVIRRLREHTALLGIRLDGAEPGDPLPPVGAVVGDFTAVTTDGVHVSRDILLGETLVAFFSSGCRPCRETLPAFIDYAADRSGGRSQILAVVAGQKEETTGFIEALTPVARAVQDLEGALSEVFQVRAFPAFCLVDAEGTVLAADMDYGHLPAPAQA